MAESVKQQLHGYRRGHELLASSIVLGRDDQDTVDRLSDISGSPGPGEVFAPYLTAYPLPSATYYVLARTWQDLAAPRAGCVLTRSLFIPMSEWMFATSLQDYLSLLVPFNRDASSVDANRHAAAHEELLDINDARLGELVEALFLEVRRPVVVYGIDNAEPIAERLLMSLWPNMRCQFGLSTFCLGPRQVSGRYLDLCFAPATARQRFSGFEGRRIDTSTRSPRHRWTSLLVERLFVAERPSLVDSSALETLEIGAKANETDLRVALLWSELWQQADASPSAALGMLDVLNSKKLLAKRLGRVQPIVARSVDSAAIQERASDALHFIDTLLGKFTQTGIPLGIAVHARRAASQIATEQPVETLQYLFREEGTATTVSRVVLAGAGAALEPKPVVIGPVSIASAGIRQRLLELLSASRRFAMKTIGLMDVQRGREAVDLVFGEIGHFEPIVRQNIRHRVLPSLTKPEHATVLACLLRDADEATVLTALRTLWRTTALKVGEFDHSLLNSVRDSTTRSNLIAAIACLPETPESDRLLARSLAMTEEDVLWVCSSQAMTEDRAARMMVAMIDAANDSELQTVFHGANTVAPLLALLQPYIATAAPQIARVLLTGFVPVDEVLPIGAAIVSHLDDLQRHRLANLLVRLGFSYAAPALEPAVVELIETGLVSTSDIREFAIAPRNGQRSVEENLALLNGLRTASRDQVLMETHELSRQLVQIPAWSIGDKGIDAWADMIRDSGRVSERVQVESAWMALEYGLHRTRESVSRLVATSFPVAYAELRRGKEPPSSAPTFFFADWDRCRTLRRNLVRAFMDSNWPPEDLLLAASHAGDVAAVLKQVLKQWRGKDYFAAILSAIERCDEPLRTHLHNEVASFQRSEHI